MNASRPEARALGDIVRANAEAKDFCLRSEDRTVSLRELIDAPWMARLRDELRGASVVVRVSDPLLPRAIFGMLNTVLFFPSGAVYPINAFPGWMKVMTTINPFRYAVHGFKSVLLKNTGLGAVSHDLLFLFGFSAIALGVATWLFRRTL